MIARHGLPMVAQPGEVRNAPAFYRPRDETQRLARAQLQSASQRVFDLGRIMTIDYDRSPVESFGLALELLPILSFGDKIALSQRIAIHDRNDVDKLMIGNEIHCLPDLPLPGLAIADDAVDAFV